MKIGINASFLRKPDTGIGQVTRGFIEELARSHPNPDKNEYFLYLEKDIDWKLPKNFRKRVFLPKLWRRDDLGRKIWWEKLLLPKKIKQDKCETFISLYPCPTFLPKNIKHKMLVHDMIPKIFPEYLDNWRKKIYTWLSWKAAIRSDKVFTVSNWSKKDIHKYLRIPLDKISVVYPSVGEEFFQKSTFEKDNQTLEKYGIYGRYIFYVGGFDFRKNIPRLLKAFKRLITKDELHNVNLVLAGEDKSRFSPLFTDIQKEIALEGLKSRVKTVGFVEQKNLPAFYRQCDLYVLPSLYEGFGLTVLEAMACGAPVAVGKTSSLPEAGGRAVLYFNPYDEEEIARVIGKVFSNPKLRKKLSEKGRERAKQFSWRKFVEGIIKQ